jgi:hypothetical protein
MFRIVSTKYYYGEPNMKNQLCGVCGTCGSEYKVLVGKPEGKGLLGIHIYLDVIIILQWN